MRFRGWWLLGAAALFAAVHLVGMLFDAPLLPAAEALMWTVIAGYAFVASAACRWPVRAGLVAAPVVLAAWALVTMPDRSTPAVVTPDDVAALVRDIRYGVGASLLDHAGPLAAFALAAAAAVLAARGYRSRTRVLGWIGAAVGGLVVLESAVVTVWDRVDGYRQEQWPQAVALALVPTAVAGVAVAAGAMALARRMWAVAGGLALIVAASLSMVDSAVYGYLGPSPVQDSAFLQPGLVVALPQPGRADWSALWPFAVRLAGVALVIAGVVAARRRGPVESGHPPTT